MSPFRVPSPSNLIRLGILLLLLVIWTRPAEAQPTPGTQGKPPGPFWSLSGSLVEQFDSDFDTQGSYSVSSLLLRASVAQPVSRKTILGLSLSYDLLDYDFSDDVVLEAASPWDRVHGLNLSVPIIRRVNERWTMLLSPSIGSYGASGAAFSDTLTFGAIFAATYAFKPDRKLGFGVAAFERIGQSRGFPFVSIDWRLTERLRLTNPLTAGPTGPAGLELAYEISPKWEFGAGGAYRNIRFRLDERDLEPNGIGEQRGIVTFARLMHTFNPKLSLVVYTGLVLDGELRIEDEDAQRRRTVGHGTAPLLALSLSGRF